MGRLSEVKNGIDNDDYGPLARALDAYDTLIQESQDWLNQFSPIARQKKPMLFVDGSLPLGGMMAMIFNAAQEADAIKEFMVDKSIVKRVKALKGYKEHYNRDVSDSMANKYADADDDFISMRELIGEMNLRLECLKGITKGLEILNYQFSNFVRLRTAGIEDTTI